VSGTRTAVLILAAGMTLSAALRIAAVTEKKTLYHDEGISYLSATGHQGDYSRIDKNRPFGTWVEASEWKKFLRIERILCFKQISSDLAHHDIHPPLYFWLLHLWSLLFGIHLWTGPSLNISISIIAIPLLYTLAHRILKDPVEAAVVAFVWALSPTVMQVSCMARQYDLLALCTILLTLRILMCADTTRNFQLLQFIFLGISVTAGVLTHYNFSIIIFGGVLFLIARLVNKNRRRLIAGLFSIATGLFLFCLIHPHFHSSIELQMAQAQAFEHAEIIPRLKAIVLTFGTFFWHGMPFIYMYSPTIIYKYIYPLLSIVIIAGLSVIYFKTRSGIGDHSRTTDHTRYYVLYFFLWTAGITVLGYIFFLSPKHAMGARYLIMAWPFFAFFPVLVIRFFGRFKTALLICLCFLQMLLGSLDMLFLNYPDSRRPEQSALLRDSGMILVDNVRRGVLPSIFWHIPDSKLLFAAEQRYLLDHREIWQSELSDNSVYVSVLLYGNSIQQQREILNLIGQNYRTIPIPGGIRGLGDVFKIEKKVPAESSSEYQKRFSRTSSKTPARVSVSPFLLKVLM
jgi:hypothetical protein